MSINLSQEEQNIHNKILELKSSAGSHSPSIQALKTISNRIDIKVDACFLSNPYATDLFLSHLKKDVLGKPIFREYLEFYPSQNDEIASNLSSIINVDKDNILIGNGASEIIESICNTLIEDNCVITLPTFSSYYEFLPKDVQRIFYQTTIENDFKIDLEDYINFVKKHKANSVIIINPNNPTGFYFKKHEIVRILEELSFCKNIILDESFIHFAYEDDSLEMINYYDLITDYPNLIIVKSMSKDFGIAGIRSGYSVMDKRIVKKFLSQGFLWNSNGLAEYFFNLYRDNDFRLSYEIERKKYIEEIKVFHKYLRKIDGIKCIPTFANFFLISLEELGDSELICSLMLLRDGIYTRNCDDKKGLDGNFLRIASRSKEENILIGNSLKGVIEN